MNYRKPSKNYDLFSAISKKRAQETQEVGILKLNKIIDWEGFRGLMEDVTGYSSKDNKKGGRPPFDPVLMLKILILQKYSKMIDRVWDLVPFMGSMIFSLMS